jgi:hypothetical protein
MSAPFWAAEHWCQEESGKVRQSFEAAALGCALLMLPAVLIQDSSLHSPWTTLSWVLGTIVWLAFTIELALTLHYATNRRAALRAHWADASRFPNLGAASGSRSSPSRPSATATPFRPRSSVA